MTYSEGRRVLICVGCGVVLIGLVVLPLSRPWAMTLGWSIPTTLLVMLVLVALFDRLIILDSTGARCRSCGYDLAGLTSPRCPECGTFFQEKQTGPPPTGAADDDQELSD